MVFDKEMDHRHLLSDETATLSSDEEEHDLQAGRRSVRNQRRKASCWKQVSWTAITVHTTIFLTYTVLLSIISILWQRSRGTPSAVAYAPFTPDSQATVFEHNHSVYVGMPSSELDDAWMKLLKNNNVRITEDEMSHIPDRLENGLKLPDGGFYATLNAYHNLHCIKRLHHYMYEDHYFPNITRRQKAANEYHSHHCLDMLRQSVICQADTQLLTMRWRSDSRVPVANWTAPHRCSNWDQVEKWAGSRRIANLMEPGYLNHPTLGPAYSNGRGDLIGETLLPETEDTNDDSVV